jgi:hypothetical protein
MGADELVLNAEPILTVKRRLVHGRLVSTRRHEGHPCRAELAPTKSPTGR